MNLKIDQENDVTIVQLPPDTLDAINAKEFKKDVSQHLTVNRKVVFDLSKINFVDSSGLGALLSCLRTLNTIHGDLKLCGMTKQVSALFELVRMHRTFDALNTREEAVRAFK